MTTWWNGRGDVSEEGLRSFLNFDSRMSASRRKMCDMTRLSATDAKSESVGPKKKARNKNNTQNKKESENENISIETTRTVQEVVYNQTPNYPINTVRLIRVFAAVSENSV
jgi:hypothetical protein